MSNRLVIYNLVKALFNILMNILKLFQILAGYALWVIQRSLPRRWQERAKRFMTKVYLKTESVFWMCHHILLESIQWILEIAQEKKQR